MKCHGTTLESFPSQVYSKVAGATNESRRLRIKIEAKLIRMRPQADSVNLVPPLVLDPGFNDVGGEDVALQQKLAIAFQRRERFVERGGRLANLRQLVGRQGIEV